MKRTKTTDKNPKDPKRRKSTVDCISCLDGNVLAYLVSFLDLPSIFKVSRTCRKIHHIVDTNSLVWRYVTLSNFHLERPHLMQTLIARNVLRFIPSLDVAMSPNLPLHYANAFPNLRTLTCMRWPLALQFLQHAPKLETLCIRGASSDSGFDQVQLQLPHLHTLQIMGANNRSLVFFSQNAHNLQHVILTPASMSGFRADISKGLSALFQRCKRLRNIHIANACFSYQVCTEIEQYAEALEHVTFTFVELLQVPTPSKMYLFTCKNLISCAISDIDLYIPNSVPIFISAVLRHLQLPWEPSVEQLQTISLKCSKMEKIILGISSVLAVRPLALHPEITQGHVQALCQYTKEHLKTLHLQSYLKQESIVLLFSESSIFPQLQELSLFTDHVAIPVSDRSHVFPMLQSLILFGSLSPLSLCNMIQACSQIKKLSLQLNHIDLFMLNMVTKYLPQLQHLELSVLQSIPHADSGSWKVLLNASVKNLYIANERVTLIEHVALTTAFEAAQLHISQGQVFNSVLAIEHEHRDVMILMIQIQVLENNIEGISEEDRRNKLDFVKNKLSLFMKNCTVNSAVRELSRVEEIPLSAINTIS